MFLLSTLGALADTYSGTCGANLQWEINTETSTIWIYKIDNSISDRLMYNFTAGTQPWYKYIQGIKKVHLSEGVQSIGRYAFAGSYSKRSTIEDVEIPQSLITIEGYSFCYNSALSRFKLSKSDPMSYPMYNDFGNVETIGPYAFQYCTSLQADEGALALTAPNVHIKALKLEKIGQYAFSDCSGISSFVAPELRQIDDYAFAGTGITKMEISKADSIGNGTFSRCTLTDIIRNDKYLVAVPAMTQGVFEIPEGIEVVCGLAFDNVNIQSVKFPSSIKELRRWSFSHCGIEEIELPSSISEYPTNCFIECPQLTKATIPSSVKKMGWGVFCGCQNLTSVTMPDHVIEVNQGEPESIFYECRKLGYIINNGILFHVPNELGNSHKGTDVIEVPEGVKVINTGALGRGNSKVVLPASVEKCYHILQRNVVCYTETPPQLDFSAYSFDPYWLSECNVFVPEESMELYKADEMWSNYNLYALPEFEMGKYGNLTWSIKDGVLSFVGTGDMKSYTNNASEYPWMTYKQDVTGIIIGEGITSVAKSAFNGFENVMSVSLPSSLRTIGQSSFSSCKALTDIEFPSNIEEIGPLAFYATGIVSVVMPQNISVLEGTFYTNRIKDMIVYRSRPCEVKGDYFFCAPTEDAILHVPYGSKDYYENSRWKAFKNIVEDHDARHVIMSGQCGDDQYWKQDENILTFYGTGGMYSYSSNTFNKSGYPWEKHGDLITTVSIEKTISSVQPNILAKCPNVEMLEIPFIGTSVSPSIDGTPLGSLWESTSSYWEIDYSNRVREMTITYKIPDCLRKIVFTGDDADMSKLVKGSEYREKGTGYWSAYWEYTRYVNSAYSIDSLIITDSHSVNFKNGTSIIPMLKDVNVAVKYKGNTTSGMFANLPKLYSLTLDVPGVGNTTNSTNFGSLFTGNSSGDGLKAIVQVFENGKSSTYYMPVNLKVTLSEECTEIPWGCFYNCSNITKLTLPSSLKSVKEKALYGCDGLEDIYCYRSLPPVAYSNTFDGVNLFACKLHIPYGSKQYYEKATGWKDFYFIEENSPLMVYVTKNIANAGEIVGVLAYKENETATISAHPHWGYKFVGWYNNMNLVCNEMKYEFTITYDTYLTAVFAPIDNENNIEVSENNSVITIYIPDSEAPTIHIGIYTDSGLTELVEEETITAASVYPTTRAISNNGNTVTITELTPETTYYYRIDGCNEHGVILNQYTGSFETTSTGGLINITNDTNCIKECYGLSGQRIPILNKGVNVVKINDRTFGKVLVK